MTKPEEQELRPPVGVYHGGAGHGGHGYGGHEHGGHGFPGHGTDWYGHYGTNLGGVLPWLVAPYLLSSVYPYYPYYPYPTYPAYPPYPYPPYPYYPTYSDGVYSAPGAIPGVYTT